jgi:hypothetical protein
MSMHEAVDHLLNDRDRIWCLALLTVEPHLGIERITAITSRFNCLLLRQEEVLAALDKGFAPRVP